MSYHTRILIVDDQPTIVAILQKILGNHYVLKTATCGEEALAIAADFSPALILLDIMMPGIDGYDTCLQLRAHPTLRHTKIIMVSAGASVTERLKGYEVGADDYITKPFDEEELLAKVRVYLRLKSVEEVDRLKSDMIALLSHEVRTPLNEILAPVDMLLAEQDMNAADRTMLLNLVQHSAQRLLRLFARISKLSQMKAGEWDYAWTTTDLCDVVRDAVSDVTSTAVQRGVHIAQAARRSTRTARPTPDGRGGHHSAGERHPLQPIAWAGSGSRRVCERAPLYPGDRPRPGARSRLPAICIRAAGPARSQVPHGGAGPEPGHRA